MGKKKLNSTHTLNLIKSEKPSINGNTSDESEFYEPVKTTTKIKKLSESCNSDRFLLLLNHIYLCYIKKFALNLNKFIKSYGLMYLIFMLIIIIGLLANKIYFNLTTLNNYYSILLPTSSESTNSDASKFKLDSLSFEKSEYLKPKTFSIINYEHVAFASIDSTHRTTETTTKNDENNVNFKSELSNFKSNKMDNINQNDFNIVAFNNDDIETDITNETQTAIRREANIAVHVAINMENEGKYEKAEKLYQYALSIDPKNIDALTHYGEYLERHKKDVVKAEHLYTIALRIQPEHFKASSNRQRTLPLVTKIDREMLDRIDVLLKEFYDIPVTNPALKRAKREAYYMHIYHSNAIEGNTLNLQQTRHIVETRMAINGKSIQEHQEVLGLDAAMRYLNETLLYKPIGKINMQDILEIHRRVLGFCDPIEAGKFRDHQVYVGSFIPPNAKHVYRLMNEFIEWLNSLQVLTEVHPVQLSALAHYKLAYIHPFYDGNGRTARLLMNLILMRAGYPPIIIRKQDRLEYYEHLETANKGDIRPFIRFIAKCTERTLKEYILICTQSGISTDTFDYMNKLMNQNDDLVINMYEKAVTLNDDNEKDDDNNDQYNALIMDNNNNNIDKSIKIIHS